jgi:hypothetical protein
MERERERETRRVVWAASERVGSEEERRSGSGSTGDRRGEKARQRGVVVPTLATTPATARIRARQMRRMMVRRDRRQVVAEKEEVGRRGREERRRRKRPASAAPRPASDLVASS